MKGSKRYVTYKREKSRRKPVRPTFETLGGFAPRSYLFAFDTDFNEQERVANALRSVPGSFLHGAAIMHKKWSFWQEAYNRRLTFRTVKDDQSVMSRFLWRVRYGVESLPMAVGAIVKYLPREISDEGVPL
ncbi:MAG: hypothetical protein KIT36_13970 [Alphaproteobacteria bacterium]|nr:hypothetical protein [Alphaproteobacteria bacterium]